MKNSDLPMELLFEDVALTRKTGIHRVSMATVDTENFAKGHSQDSNLGTKEMGFGPLKSEKKAYDILKDDIEEVINRLDKGYSKLDTATKIKVLDELAKQYKIDLEKENKEV